MTVVNYLERNLDVVDKVEVISTQKVKYYFNQDEKRRIVLVDLENNLTKSNYKLYELNEVLKNKANEDIDNFYY